MFRFSSMPTRGGDEATPEEAQTDESVSREADDQVPPLTALSAPMNAQDTLPIQSVPPWVRELNNSRVTRHSRASSIVSTRTKFSTTTLQEDARSIDINVGGQYFRISRDGSRITADAPPPYTGPSETVRFRGGQASDVISLDSRFGPDEDEIEEDDLEDGARTPRSSFAILDVDAEVRANILDPTEFNMPSPVGPDQVTPRRSPSAAFTSGESVSDHQDLPAQRPSSSETETDDLLQHNPFRARNTMPHSSPLRRANGIRLPALITSHESSPAIHRPWRSRPGSTPSPGRPLQVRSAGPVLSQVPQAREPRSPDYIGRNARGSFPLPVRSVTSQGAVTMAGTASGTETGPFDDAGEPDDHHKPLPMDTENEISLHYARMMRKLDYAHRKMLHLKDKELAELRIKLHEKDTVLRQQLRAKDFIIDDLKMRLANLEENVETMLEKARHQVEDLWESRWKDRDFHLRERMRRIEEEAQKTIERLRAGSPESNAGRPSLVPTG